MAKKSFVIILILLMATFLFGLAVKNYKPSVTATVDINDFPLQKGEWTGQVDNLTPGIIQMLNPTVIFSAAYVNADGIKVQLFFDYFSSLNNIGGPHSPRNCLPGSGWLISGSEEREIELNRGSIKAGRFFLQLKESTRVMDFWYVSRRGETANDYRFKFDSMVSSLTFQPNDMAFIRIVCDNDPVSLEALNQFEKQFVDEIYVRLPFWK